MHLSPQHWGDGDREIPGPCWPASLAKSNWPIASHTCAPTNTHMCTYTQIHIKMYKHNIRCPIHYLCFWFSLSLVCCFGHIKSLETNQPYLDPKKDGTHDLWMPGQKAGQERDWALVRCLLQAGKGIVLFWRAAYLTLFWVPGSWPAPPSSV